MIEREGNKSVSTLPLTNGVVKLTFKSNYGITNLYAGLLEVFTHHDGCAIINVPTEDLTRLKHFLNMAIIEIERVQREDNG